MDSEPLSALAPNEIIVPVGSVIVMNDILTADTWRGH